MQNKIIAKILTVNKFVTMKFCSAIHVYTDRFADMGIIVIRPPWVRCEFLAELPLVLIFWLINKVLDSSI